MQTKHPFWKNQEEPNPHGHVVHATETQALEPLNNKKHHGLEQREQKL